MSEVDTVALLLLMILSFALGVLYGGHSIHLPRRHH